jgi:hypothetical protein
MRSNTASNPGDVCSYWNKLVIVHRMSDEGWAEVIKIKNPSKPYETLGAPFSVRLSQLELVREADDEGAQTK